jgi:hypothetical protein
MHDGEHQIPIWFFIGLVLAVYGVLILGAGLYGVLYPPPLSQRLAMSHLHAELWWGALLVLLGAFYSWRFRPRDP